MNTTTHRVRTAAVIATACAAVIVTAPSAVAIPQGDGAEPGPTQHEMRPAQTESPVVPAFDVATDDRPCFIWRGTWNTADGPEQTCAAPPTAAVVTPVSMIEDPPCVGVVDARYAPTPGTDPEPTACAPVDHWWDFVPA